MGKETTQIESMEERDHREGREALEAITDNLKKEQYETLWLKGERLGVEVRRNGWSVAQILHEGKGGRGFSCFDVENIIGGEGKPGEESPVQPVDLRKILEIVARRGYAITTAWPEKWVE